MSTKLRTESAILWRLAGPLIVAQLSQVGMGFTDTVMAGRLSPLDLAAVAIGSMLLLSVFLLFFGILNSVSPTIAQLKGAGRDRDIGRVF
ncbi:MAG: MATE family efflux transporter, partial [Gammaproteobacteria bacterium]|nr:MATE family efflux transporter [Gammaproteobacteria bacterium]